MTDANGYPIYDEPFDDWMTKLDEETIQGEFGYERGEFTAYPASWRHMYDEGLTPREAWLRAMDARAALATAKKDEKN